MAENCNGTIDPRIRRTRVLLQDALGKLLETKEFDKISVQDISEQATLNRATFYDHYTDKFALLECMVASRFAELLEARGVRFDGGCSAALRGMVLGVVDYLAGVPRLECERQLQMEPHLEAAVVAVVRGMLLEGVRRHPPRAGVAPELLAATLSGAIHGAAKEWLRTQGRCPAEQAVEEIMGLVGPVFAAAYAPLAD